MNWLVYHGHLAHPPIWLMWVAGVAGILYLVETAVNLVRKRQ